MRVSRWDECVACVYLERWACCTFLSSAVAWGPCCGGCWLWWRSGSGTGVWGVPWAWWGSGAGSEEERPLGPIWTMWRWTPGWAEGRKDRETDREGNSQSSNYPCVWDASLAMRVSSLIAGGPWDDPWAFAKCLENNPGGRLLHLLLSSRSALSSLPLRRVEPIPSSLFHRLLLILLSLLSCLDNTPAPPPPTVGQQHGC